MTEPFYAPHQLAELQEGYYAVNRTYEQLLGEYLSLRLTSEAAYEYARHGFVRRLGTLKRCTGTSTGRLMIAVLAASPTLSATLSAPVPAGVGVPRRKGKIWAESPSSPVQAASARRSSAPTRAVARTYEVDQSTISGLTA
jgi:hypothetical protein